MSRLFPLKVWLHRKTILSKGKDDQDHWFVTRKVLILTHGNGEVESGFSINEDSLNENLKQKLIVAQQVVYEDERGCL